MKIGLFDVFMLRASRSFLPIFPFTNAHFSTIWPALFVHPQTPSYQTLFFETPDEDVFELSVLHRDRPRALVLLHGLEGNAQSGYMNDVAQFFETCGFGIYALNHRGCGRSPNRRFSSYHSGFTNDLQQVLQYVQSDASIEEIYILGFSLGGNIVLKWAGEQAGRYPSKLRKCIAVSVPCDLAACAETLSKGFNRMYLHRFLRSLISKVLQKKNRIGNGFDFEKASQIKDFKDFDDWYTAPVHGFRDAIHYWKLNSSLRFLNSIEIPCLLINALNDPFLASSCFPDPSTILSSFVQTCYPKYGGHVGFMKHCFDRRVWLKNTMINFFDSK
jgi:predicted alpha/beta-fold hydrolase